MGMLVPNKRSYQVLQKERGQRAMCQNYNPEIDTNSSSPLKKDNNNTRNAAVLQQNMPLYMYMANAAHMTHVVFLSLSYKNKE